MSAATLSRRVAALEKGTPVIDTLASFVLGKHMVATQTSNGTRYSKSSWKRHLGDAQGHYMFERQDWELFRNLDGLSAKAGVPRDKIALLVAEELMDNALDESESYDMGLLDDNEGFFVQDNGPGIDPAQASSLFSIKRPLKSTKLFRPPSRGALGNGLRVAPHATLILHISYVTGILFIAGKDWCRRRRFLPDYLLD